MNSPIIVRPAADTRHRSAEWYRLSSVRSECRPTDTKQITPAMLGTAESQPMARLLRTPNPSMIVSPQNPNVGLALVTQN